MFDVEDTVTGILEKTVFIWVIPYAVWYMCAHMWQSVWDWVTEPEEAEYEN